jgi:N-acetylglucosamine-6-phosphate deacetylase
MTQRREVRWFDRSAAARISWSGPTIEQVEEASIDAASLPWACPGLVDLQVNGLGGVNFGDPGISLEGVARVTGVLAEHGVTHFLPTLITDDIDRMKMSLARLAKATSDPRLNGSVLGFHLEGPYLSSEDGPRGAHPLEHCKDPDWNEFCSLQEAADGKIRMMTLAPERAGAIEFIREATKGGVRVAIGHTSAKREEILAAVDAGASLATHLGNAAHDRIQRHHNTIFDQLGEDRLWASLIVDGHHLPPHVVKIFVRAKGLEKIILVSDAVQYAGLPAGIYDGGYRQFQVREDGFIGVVGEPRLAGSGLLLSRAVENFTSFMGEESPAAAIRCASIHPRQWLTGRAIDGSLRAGDEASLVLYDWDAGSGRFGIRETIRNGEVVFSRGDF